MLLLGAPGAYGQGSDAELTDGAAHETALQAYDAGDFTTAYRQWKALAEQGHAEAQYYLAVLYRDGAGVTQDYAQAQAWYRRAGEQGYAQALHDLAVMHQAGIGIQQDFAQALAYLERAAELGYAPSQYNLGVLLVQGRGREADVFNGYLWIFRAAEQGLEEAQQAQPIVGQRLSLEQLRQARQIIESEHQSP